MFVNTVDTVLILVNLMYIYGSHFRGGTITWRHIENQQIDLTYKLSFHRSRYFCDESNQGTLVSGEGSLSCTTGCSYWSSYLVSLMSFYCTEYSEEEDWIYGQRTVNVTLPTVWNNIYQFSYSGNAWIDIQSGGGYWALLSTANLTIRQDIGRINSPPSTYMPAVVRFKQTCYYSMSIPVKDEDSDIIRCRWAVTSSECAGVCKKLYGSVLDEERCILSYQATGMEGMYAVALQIEDFATEQAVNALSSIPLQFLINMTLYNSTDSCNNKPVFETLKDIEIPINITYHQTYIARGFRISEMNVTTPKGMTKSEMLKHSVSNDRWYVNVSWTPTEMDLGNHTVCCAAFDSISQASNQICITLQVINANLCEEDIDRFHTKWSITQENTHITLSCTDEYSGNVSRNCSSGGIWDEPDYSRCISKSMIYILEQLNKLLFGNSDDDFVSNILEDLENITRNNYELRSGDLLTASAILHDIATYVIGYEDETSLSQLDILGSLCNNLLDERNHESWTELNDKGLNGVTSLVNAITDYSNELSQVINTEATVIVAKDNVVMQVGKTGLDEISVPDRSKTSDSWIADSATEIKLKKNICSGLTGYSSTFYRNISSFFPKYLILNGEVQSFNGSYDINSIIADFTIHGTSCSDYSLIIKFEHLLGDYSTPFCGFWDFGAHHTTNGAWSSFGSRVVESTDSYTVCEYNHTTNFAMLMSPGRTPLLHQFPLSLISAIGCGVSILCLLITILMYSVLLWHDTKLRIDRTKILLNLCVALILSYSIFLAGITRTDNKDVCTAIAVALHYMFLTDFALMLAEGILILKMFVFVFHKESITNRLLPACWVVPAGIVGISAIVTKLEGYGNHQFCWLTLESNLIWAFIGPALLVILINFVIFAIMVYRIMTARGFEKKSLKMKSKVGFKSVCILLPLFGVTWVLGVFSMMEKLVIFQYLFAIFNSLQIRNSYKKYQKHQQNSRMVPNQSSTNWDSKRRSPRNNVNILAHNQGRKDYKSTSQSKNLQSNLEYYDSRYTNSAFSNEDYINY
ncbi:adhesion G protein-coupled receptor B1-like isoform X2 [Mytilus galloprovincialis]|uniref:adhesion G protein-coupled receptor B1-like isoform X2 n=1 Tax=Mytilus galloprovincialis TaxID=29158 RepID=UPI003F7BBAC2